MQIIKKAIFIVLSIFSLISCATNNSDMGANVPNENNIPLDNTMSAPTDADINLN